MKKQLQLFLLPEDEREISVSLRNVRPRVVYLDDNVWEGSEPVVRSTLDECRTPFAYLWDPAVASPLPTFRRKDGRLEGPVAGVVVQLIRSQVRSSVLRSGRVAAGTGGTSAAAEQAMRSFVTDVWRVVTQATQGGMNSFDRGSGRILRHDIREYRAGPHAVAWLRGSSDRFFQDRSTPTFFRVS